MWSQDEDEDVISPLSPVSPVASAPSSSRKRCLRHHSTLQPEPSHWSEQQAVVSDVDCTPIASPVNSNGDCFSLTAESSEVKAVRSMDIHSGPVERIDFLTDCDIFSVKKSECMDKTLCT
ncbi:unnamed protein product [Oreochromis niloticus]|nr:unnamed protein product [Mustela putorius furo]